MLAYFYCYNIFMKIRIICVGKIKEKFYIQAIDEYVKRLGKFSQIEIVEVADEKTYENSADNELTKMAEAERIISKLKNNDYKIALCIDGREFNSIQLSKKMEDIMQISSNITFIIGGSVGLHDSVIKLADLKLSFSKFTFPHNLMRLILVEQIYRSFKIMKNEPYHK